MATELEMSASLGVCLSVVAVLIVVALAWYLLAWLRRSVVWTSLPTPPPPVILRERIPSPPDYSEWRVAA